MPFGAAHLDLKQLVGSLRTVHTGGGATQALLPTWPFVTISRQAGAGGRTCGTLLAEYLNERDRPDHRWQSLDRELVDRIAADHHLSQDLINSLERSSHTWITEFFGGLSLADHRPSEISVFRRVVQTMRSLARAGHVILVGFGGVFVTRDMPGGLHLRIVAPLEWRIANLARLDNLPLAQARQRVELLDRDRLAFYRKFWPGKPISQEDFHVTFNASMLSDEQMARAAATLIPKAADESTIGVTWNQPASQHV